MRRRHLLAAFASAVGSLAGCPAAEPARNDPTVTPAPVPTPADAEGRRCPEPLPNVETHVCAGTEAAEGAPVRLRPLRDRLLVDVTRGVTGQIELLLENRGSALFRTGRDRWRLARYDVDGWQAVASGERTDRLLVEPGETFRWRLGGSVRPDTDDSETVTHAVSPGRYAFVVDGTVLRGDRLGLVAPFDVRVA